jgi:ribosomal protein S18 acetylase RimI-like enzyme
MLVRRLAPADWQDYRTIRLRGLTLAPEAFGADHDDEAALPAESFAERLAISVVFGAYADDRIVGVAGFKQAAGLKEVHKAFVWGVFVEPDHQHKGVGQALISALIDGARETVEQLILTVVEDNTTAVALYERNGFTAYGVEPRALKTAAGYVDEVLMVRFL